MTKPISRKMAVDCLLYRSKMIDGLYCGICFEDCLPEQNIQFDHIHADVHGGPHEYQNLRPTHAGCHKKKTKADIQANAKVKRIQAGGRKRRGPKLKSKPFPKERCNCDASCGENRYHDKGDPGCRYERVKNG